MHEDLEKIINNYRLTIPRSPEGRGFGDRTTGGTGSSLEYEDHREYTPGDDLRRIDWRAYGRTGEYIVKQYREEVYPAIDMIIDQSRSMGFTEPKHRYLMELLTVLVRMAEDEHLDVQVIGAGDRVRNVTDEFRHRHELSMEGRRQLPRQVPEITDHLRSGALRFLISDFLFPHEPGDLVGTLLRNSSGIRLIQVLSEVDRDPDLEGGVRLQDVETGDQLDSYVSDTGKQAYRKALRKHCDQIREAAKRLEALYARCFSRQDLPTSVRDRLVPAGILES